MAPVAIVPAAGMCRMANVTPLPATKPSHALLCTSSVGWLWYMTLTSAYAAAGAAKIAHCNRTMCTANLRRATSGSDCHAGAHLAPYVPDAIM